MMLVSHLLFAQYPTTRTIKGQDVVIMTVPQAQEIDNRFKKLKDSIKGLNQYIEELKKNCGIKSVEEEQNPKNDVKETQIPKQDTIKDTKKKVKENKYPTTKVIKGEEVVIMSVNQAQDIDNRFNKLKDSIKILNSRPIKECNDTAIKLKETNDLLIKIDKKQDTLIYQSLVLNEYYLKELEKWKKIRIEDRLYSRRVITGLSLVAALWMGLVVTNIFRN